MKKREEKRDRREKKKSQSTERELEDEALFRNL